MTLLEDILYRFLEKCEQAGIRNPAEFLISKMPMVYSDLKGAFPRGILPTDIDGEVELNGYFLRFEFKHESRLKCGGITKGQLLLFEALIKTGYHTVFLIGFDRNGIPTVMHIFGQKGRKEVDCDGWKTVREYCISWSHAMERKPRIT